MLLLPSAESLLTRSNPPAGEHPFRQDNSGTNTPCPTLPNILRRFFLILSHLPIDTGTEKNYNIKIKKVPLGVFFKQHI